MYSESFFEEPPIQIQAGSEGKIFYAHPGIFTPFPKSTLYARINGPWNENDGGVLDMTDFDEHTIKCCLSYFYRRTYHPHDDTSKPDPKTQNDEVKAEKTTSNGTGESSKGKGTSANPESKQTNAMLSNKDSPLEPIESMPEQLPVPEANKQDISGENKETLVAEALVHARVYSFAHMYILSELEAVALNRLKTTLVTLQKHKKAMEFQLANAARVIYSSTKNPNPAREVISRFTAINFTFLVGSHLEELMQEGGDFALDVSLKLVRDCPPKLRSELRQATAAKQK